MTQTLGGLITRIARELDREDDTDKDDIRSAILATLADVMRRDLWPLDTRRARLTTKCGQQWYQVLDDSLDAISGDMGCEPTSEICDPLVAGKVRDFVDIDSIRLMFPKCGCGKCNMPPETCRLCHIGKDEFECLTHCEGCPTHFTFDGSAIGLWPVPTCAWKMAICGNFKFPAPKTDEGTHPLLCDAEELIKRGAKMRYYLDMEDDSEDALAEKLLFEEQVRLLENEKFKKKFSGNIRRRC